MAAKMQERYLAAAFLLATVVVSSAWAAELPAEKPIPGFRVVDMQGQPKDFHSLSSRVTVVIFFSTRCPMSNAFNYRRNQLYREFRDRARFIVIDPNANESMLEIRAYAEEVKFDFPVYRDVDNQVADLFGARNTTETFVLDSTGKVRYRGFIEDAPNPERTTIQGLRRAIGDVLARRTVVIQETRGIGCAIRRTHPQISTNGAAAQLVQ
jgi:peroxiredoxin